MGSRESGVGNHRITESGIGSRELGEVWEMWEVWEVWGDGEMGKVINRRWAVPTNSMVNLLNRSEPLVTLDLDRKFPIPDSRSPPGRG